MTQPVIREVGRFVVKLPDNANFHTGPHLVPITFDQEGDQVHARLLADDRSLRYLAPWELLGHCLCGDRAQRCVDQTLLLGDRPVTPEAYLKLWRTAIGRAESPQALFKTHGLQLVASFSAPLALMAGASAYWTDSPFRNWQAVQTCYGAVLRVQDGQFTLRLDLRRDNAARDAFHIADMVSGACHNAAESWHCELRLEGTPRKVPVDAATTPELFADEAHDGKEAA